MPKDHPSSYVKEGFKKVSPDETKRMAKILDRLRSEFKLWPSLGSPFSVLVWTVLSQNTSDRNAELAYNRLTSRFRNFKQLARADLRTIQRLIRPAGLYKAKSKHLRELSRIVINKYGGDLKRVLKKPLEKAREELLKLPGIGYKTADCLLFFSAGRDVLPVDTHVARLAKRLGYAMPEDDREKVREKLMKAIPKGRRGEAHMLLIQHGRKYCRARKPLCAECPINQLCPRLFLKPQA